MAAPALQAGLLVGVLVAVMLMTPALSLHEDQAGLRDWHHQYLGKVTHASFQKKRVYVATERSAVAALNLRTGEIHWRQVFEDGDAIDAMVGTAQQVMTLSGGGKYLRSWNPPDGSLVWEEATYTSAPDPSGKVVRHPEEVAMVSAGDVDGDGVEDVVLLARGVVQVRHGAGGEVIWNAETLDRVDGATFHSLEVSGQEIIVLGTVDDEGQAGLAALRLRLDTGEIISTHSGSTKAPMAAPVLLAGGHAAALDAAGTTLYAMPIKGTTPKPVGTPVAKLGGAAGAAASMGPAAVGGLVPVVMPTGTVLVDVSSSGGPVRASGEALPGGAAVSLPLKDGSAGCVAIGAAGGTLEVLQGGKTALSESFPLTEGEVGPAAAAWLNSYTRKDGSQGYRALVVGADHTLALVQQGSVVWRREEALASVVQVQIVDLPTPSAELSAKEKAENQKSIWDTIEGQILNIKVRLRMATPEEKLMMIERKRASGEKLRLSRDGYGFRKLIVALSSSGKLLGLHNGDGRVLWSRTYRPSPGSPLPTHMVVSRNPHSMDPHAAIELMLLGMEAGCPSTRASWVDAHTGAEVKSEVLPYTTRQLLTLAAVDSSERRAFLLVDTKGFAHALPDTEEVHGIVEDSRETIHFYEVDKKSNAVRGYGLRAANKAGVWPEDELWASVFPRGTETILSTAQPNLFEPINTAVKVLGDRSVLVKYINPNTIFVATGEPPNAAERADVDATLKAYLIDTVTGRVLYRVAHAHSTGPVHAVFSENWVAYHYWNVLAHRHEVSVLELYDDAATRQEQGAASAMFAALTGANLTAATRSSYAPPPLRVLGQSYFFGMSVKSMSVTSTARGITAKAVLLGTVNDMVLMMDKRFLDPRRPVTPTHDDREEGLMMYSEILPIVPHHFVTYGNQVLQLRGVVTAPSRLESTSLMLAYGLDLFYTITTPSRTYDLLDEDFSYALLLLTVAGLGLGAIVTGGMVAKQDLDKKWM